MIVPVRQEINRAASGKAADRELALQKLVTAFIGSGLVFLLLPGTFLGVWSLIKISSHGAVQLAVLRLDPSARPSTDVWLDRYFCHWHWILLAV